MNYPSWAPAELVDNLIHQQSHIRDHEEILTKSQINAEIANALHGSLLPLDDSDSPFSLSRMKMTAQIAERMLTDLRAKEIWETISSMEPATPIPGGKWSIEFDFMSACDRSYQMCTKYPTHTPKEKRIHLEKIASLAASLAEQVGSSPYLHDKGLLIEAATQRPYDYSSLVLWSARDNARQTRHAHEEKWGQAFDSWCKANGFSEEHEPSEEEARSFIYTDDDEPELNADMLVEAFGDLTLSGALIHLAKECQTIASEPPLAAQPNGAGWKKTLFVRTMSNYLAIRFGKPMWRILALTTSVALDLETLGEEDIMPLVNYQKKTSKKG